MSLGASEELNFSDFSVSILYIITFEKSNYLQEIICLL